MYMDAKSALNSSIAASYAIGPTYKTVLKQVTLSSISVMQAHIEAQRAIQSVLRSPAVHLVHWTTSKHKK